MDANRFDAVARLFARRRLSRRQALSQGGVGLAAGALAATGFSATAAQDAIPPPTPAGDHGPTMLFIQSFQSGTIVPKAGEDGRYTVTLEQGLGQTIYFSDRPDRLVGTTPTDRFLAGIGFPEDNPPNAALVVETAPGETDIAVVELFNPVLDPASDGVTYDIAVLANWETSLELGFADGPIDLAAVAPSFGTAHLFIDDCPNSNVGCWVHDGNVITVIGYVAAGEVGAMCYSAQLHECIPCEPWFESHSTMTDYWTQQCNTLVSDCNGRCGPTFPCGDGGMPCFLA